MHWQPIDILWIVQYLRVTSSKVLPGNHTPRRSPHLWKCPSPCHLAGSILLCSTNTLSNSQLSKISNLYNRTVAYNCRSFGFVGCDERFSVVVVGQQWRRHPIRCVKPCRREAKGCRKSKEPPSVVKGHHQGAKAWHRGAKGCHRGGRHAMSRQWPASGEGFPADGIGGEGAQ
jgi:hypothetical protein